MFVVTFATQEMLLFRNAVSREIVVGAENRVEQCTYAAVITRVAEEMSDEITGGWKVIEVMSSSCIEYGANECLPSECHRWRVDHQEHICSHFRWTFIPYRLHHPFAYIICRTLKYSPLIVTDISYPLIIPSVLLEATRIHPYDQLPAIVDLEWVGHNHRLRAGT